MSKSSFTQRLAPLGRVQAIDRVRSGSPEEIVLKLGAPAPDAIAATLALAKRCVTMLKAKRAVEKALEGEMAILNLPMVEDMDTLEAELRDAGLEVGFRSLQIREYKTDFPARLKRLRKRLGKTQGEFAGEFNLDMKTLQGWEIGKVPDRGNLQLIRMIEKDPETVKRLVNEV